MTATPFNPPAAARELEAAGIERRQDRRTTIPIPARSRRPGRTRHVARVHRHHRDRGCSCGVEQRIARIEGLLEGPGLTARATSRNLSRAAAHAAVPRGHHERRRLRRFQRRPRP